MPIPLVERARAGDRDAFAALYDATARPLLLYALAFTPRVDDAEDALHAAYLAAWQRLPTLRDPARFLAWLFRIVRHAALDLVRRDRRHAPLPDGVAAPALDAGPGAPLAELLEGLADETRALLLLRHALAWDVPAIARVLDASEPTVRRRLARAQAHLRARHEGRLAHGR
ncbi:MAG: sigma-70 family RNA polymerase sigma factor [Planctomycetes bacterium]|nr:sigma-70 family RNA polymerase sigma factor [Planctomycetota bacterium]